MSIYDPVVIFSDLKTSRSSYHRPPNVWRAVLGTTIEEEDARQIEELRRLRKAMARKRRQAEIERLKKELSGGDPGVSL